MRLCPEGALAGRCEGRCRCPFRADNCLGQVSQGGAARNPGLYSVAPLGQSRSTTTPMTLPRSSTSAPPELPGWMGALIWKCRASSCAPARLAISSELGLAS